MTSRQRVLARLIAARRGEYVATIGSTLIPDGWIPLWAVQGGDCGGSAANVRLWELQAPVSRGGCGIPIEWDTFRYAWQGRKRRVPVYRLAVEPALIEALINVETTAVNHLVVAARGLQLREEAHLHCGKLTPCTRLAADPKPLSLNLFAQTGSEYD